MILRDTPRTVRLRENIGRRMGRHVFAGYRLVRPVVRLAGRPVTLYRGTSDLDRFLSACRNAWPHAAIVVIPPLRRSIARAEQRRLEARLIADAGRSAQRAGVDFLDPSEALSRADGRLRCANGYNLNEAGSQLLAELLLEWLEASCSNPASRTS